MKIMKAVRKEKEGKKGKRRRKRSRKKRRKRKQKKEFLKCTNIDSSDILRSQKINLKETWKNKLL